MPKQSKPAPVFFLPRDGCRPLKYADAEGPSMTPEFCAQNNTCGCSKLALTSTGLWAAFAVKGTASSRHFPRSPGASCR